MPLNVNGLSDVSRLLTAQDAIIKEHGRAIIQALRYVSSLADVMLDVCEKDGRFSMHVDTLRKLKSAGGE